MLKRKQCWDENNLSFVRKRILQLRNNSSQAYFVDSVPKPLKESFFSRPLMQDPFLITIGMENVLISQLKTQI